VFTVDPEAGLTLIELAQDETVPNILMETGCEFQISPDMCTMRQADDDDD
jgi:hypothetical protein